MTGPDVWEVTLWIVGLLGAGAVVGGITLGTVLYIMLRSGTKIIMEREKEGRER